MLSAPLKFVGRFQWWHYTPTHGQLLLRRTKGQGQATRVDVLFKDVSVVRAATVFDNLEVNEVDPAAVPGLARIMGALPLSTRHVFALRGNGMDGVVVAGEVFFREDELEYYEPSGLLTGGGPDHQ